VPGRKGKCALTWGLFDIGKVEILGLTAATNTIVLSTWENMKAQYDVAEESGLFLYRILWWE
jgi:hypothetical protein